MRARDEVIECFLVSGQSDYVLRIAHAKALTTTAI